MGWDGWDEGPEEYVEKEGREGIAVREVL